MGNRTKKVGPTRGLGPRYGSTVRKRYIKVMQEMKKPHKCPQCGFSRVKRESVGIWKCRKCGFTYTGGAYTPITAWNSGKTLSQRHTGRRNVKDGARRKRLVFPVSVGFMLNLGFQTIFWKCLNESKSNCTLEVSLREKVGNDSQIFRTRG